MVSGWIMFAQNPAMDKNRIQIKRFHGKGVRFLCFNWRNLFILILSHKMMIAEALRLQCFRIQKKRNIRFSLFTGYNANDLIVLQSLFNLKRI